MPTIQISEERREELRRQEWEDRQYWNEVKAAERAHELRLAETKLVAANSLKIEAAKVNNFRDRLIVRCITLLALFGRPVPSVLEDLLNK